MQCIQNWIDETIAGFKIKGFSTNEMIEINFDAYSLAKQLIDL